MTRPGTEPAEAPAPRLRCLVVEDDPALREQLVAAIDAAGHAVEAVGDGAAAARAVARAPHALVVVDLDLGGAPDAFALCRAIRDGAEGAHAFVLVVTPRDGTRDLLAALDAGADDYVSKPLSGRHLAARLAIAARRIAQGGARRAAEAELARARWLAGIGETSIALQHEINNPLAALLGHAALIEHGLVEPGEEREILQVVVEQAHRIAGVVKRLSALRNPQSVEYLRGARMIDLSRREGARATPPDGTPASAAPPPDGAPSDGARPDGAPPDGPPER